MITYDLKCKFGHVFEGWFENSESFEKQAGQGLISCPQCGSTEISRTPSAFAISKYREQPTWPEPPQSPPDGIIPPRPEELFQRFIEANFENVGVDFTKEALKMHYGVTESRSIRGVSTAKEEEMLKQEGISFFKFPDFSKQPPDDED